MSTIRPAGSGKTSQAFPFVRTSANPQAGLVLVCDADVPSDWPIHSGGAGTNLAHGLGWTCEIRRNDVVLLNPLGEGLVNAGLPELSVEWLTHVRQDGSSAVYLVPSEMAPTNGVAEMMVDAALACGRLGAATVRTAISTDYGQQKPVGRNEPCPCESGKKYKHCHG